MANVDDVLDNWEQIDEAGLTNSLQKYHDSKANHLSNAKSLPVDSFESRIKQNATFNGVKKYKTLNVHQKNSIENDNIVNVLSKNEKSPLDDMASTFQPVMMVLHKSNDEYQSANYVQPINSQTVKILRRPTQSSEPRNNGMRPRQPIKTLQQREQEYAEARLRILGSAKNPDDDQGMSNTTTPSVIPTIPALSTVKVDSSNKEVNTPNGYNHYYNVSPNHHQHNPQNNHYYQQKSLAFNNRTVPTSHHQASNQTWSSPAVGSISTQSLRHSQNDTIIRMPRGPDGSTGFQMRR